MKINVVLLYQYEIQNAIKERLETLSEDKKIIENFQINALNKMKNQTWESYVSNLDQFILDYKNKKN